jgi:hypothetical protein
MASPAIVSILPFVEGDTWPGITSIAILEDGVPPTSDASVAVLRFAPSRNAPRVSVELSSADSEVTITDPNLWTFAVPATDLPQLKAGTYVYAFRVTNVAGDTTTYLEGEIEVLPRI